MKIIIIGNGMVSYKFCDKIRKKNTDGQVQITIYGEEHRPAYDRVHLSEYFEQLLSVEPILNKRG